MYLKGSQRGTRIGRKKRIARTAGNNRHTSAFKKGHCRIPVIVSCHRLHRSRRKNFRRNAFGTQCHCKPQTVDYRRQHPHLVSIHTVESSAGPLEPTENIPSSYNYRHLFSFTDYRSHFGSIVGKTAFVYAKPPVPAETFAAQFQ